jgi:hypothetical protein
MIPKWQMAGLFILVALLAGFAVYTSPNSYAYAFLSGQCGRDPVPAICHRFTSARGSGMRSTW